MSKKGAADCCGKGAGARQHHHHSARGGEGGPPLSLAQAKKAFMGLVERLRSPADARSLASWVSNLFDEEEENPAAETLHTIAAELRAQLPLDANAPGEHVVYPQTGDNSECTAANTVHVDGFLYDDDEVDVLVDEGKLTRALCTACGSRATQPLNFISHSMSIAQLEHLYGTVLPDLDGLTLVDVGSRLGAVLYAGHCLSTASKLIGIELNAFFCELQRGVIARHNMGDRVQIVQGDVQDHGALLREADVIVFNNVFQFFASVEQQQALWRFVRAHTRPGCMIVSVPALETALADAKSDVALTGWVQREPVEETGDEDLDALCLYTTDPE
eukprot:m.242657 g.242657  ORF g.242657 m.242657 type:complete len:331 (+) comp25986_c0_seq1:153-1145(+)